MGQRCVALRGRSATPGAAEARNLCEGCRRTTGDGRDISELGQSWDNGGSTRRSEMEMEQQVQVEYVVLLERAVGAIWDGKVKECRKAAAAAEQ
jgi:hypothetical protein